jgi:cytochrome P450
MSEAVKEPRVIINPLELPYQDPLTTPLDELDVARPQLFEKDEHWTYFERLRKEAPVHYCKESAFGPYWSISDYKHIKEVDQTHNVFSSEPAITIDDQDEEFKLPMFIAMDQPKHDQQRKVVQPVVVPRNLQKFESVIRERTGQILDEVPHNEEFDWVEHVSVELTTLMLATIFGFPMEDKHKLTYWSDVATGGVFRDFTEESQQKAYAELLDCLGTFTDIWHERVKNPGEFDLITMLAHNETTKDMVNDPMEYLGNLLLLIVGGNDTTRNSMTGSVYALNKFMGEYDKLRSDESLIPNMVAEVIRWQTPLAHMRRKAKQDVELGGKIIKAGDKVIMWYVSGNRDEKVFEDPHKLMIDRKNARQHVSFGFGIHRCMGNRLAEMQLKILWEEIQARFRFIEVMDEPKRSQSVFVKGYNNLPVRVQRK